MPACTLVMRKLWPSAVCQKRRSRWKAEVAQAAEPLGENLVVGHHHAAFAGGDDLVRIEAEAGERADPAGAAAVTLGAMRFGGVLDDGEAVDARELHERRHVGHVAVHVHGHDGAGARRDLARDLAHVEAPGVGLAVDQHGNAAGAQHGECAGDDGEARQDDFGARGKLQRLHGELERGGAVAERNAVPHAAILRPSPLELGDETAFRGYPGGIERLHGVGARLRVEQRLGDRNHDRTRLHDRSSGPLVTRAIDPAIPGNWVLSMSPA